MGGSGSNTNAFATWNEQAVVSEHRCSMFNSLALRYCTCFVADLDAVAQANRYRKNKAFLLLTGAEVQFTKLLVCIYRPVSF